MILILTIESWKTKPWQLKKKTQVTLNIGNMEWRNIECTVSYNVKQWTYKMAQY